MKKKQGLRLRHIADQHMIVGMSETDVNLADVYTLNQTASELWEMIGDAEVDAEALAQWLHSAYDVDLPQARRDVDAQLAQWQQYGLLID